MWTLFSEPSFQTGNSAKKYIFSGFFPKSRKGSFAGHLQRQCRLNFAPIPRKSTTDWRIETAKRIGTRIGKRFAQRFVPLGLPPREVLAEITYILSSKRHPFQLTHREISAKLRQILSLEAIQVPDKSVYKRAADIFEDAKIDFEDCVIVAQLERNKLRELLSYDRHFDRFGQVARVAPEPIEKANLIP